MNECRAPQASKFKLAFWISRLAMTLSAVLGAGALFYSTMEPDWLRVLLTMLFILVVCVTLVMRPRRVGFAAWIIAASLLLLWFVSDSPSNHRDWAPEYAIPATWSQEGDVVTVRHIRNFAWEAGNDYIPSYYDATYALDDLSTVDLVASYWSGDAIAHVFVTFGFRDGRHLAFSIETRRQRRFAYSVVAGFFHYFELIYVVADERDLIGVRTDIRHEQVYLYRLNLTQSARDSLFLSYLAAVRRLASQPQWYNTITDNCTTGILERADAKAGTRYDWRILLSGYAPQLAYARGYLNTKVSFPVLRRASLIVRPSGATPDERFSKDIRQRLPFLTFSSASADVGH